MQKIMTIYAEKGLQVNDGFQFNQNIQKTQFQLFVKLLFHEELTIFCDLR